MVAFSARRFVWSAMERIRLTAAPIRSAAPVRPTTIAPASSARVTTRSTEDFACRAWRLSSSMEAANSSEPAATASTFRAVWLEDSAVSSACLTTRLIESRIAAMSASMARWPSARRCRSST